MKSILYSLLFGSALISCTHKDIQSKHLSTISVVRETETKSIGQPENPNIYTNPNIPTPPPTIRPSSSTRYHIIVSSFGYSEKTKAEKLVAKLKAKNYPASLIFSSQRYRVSIESFPTESEANTARDEYRNITDRQDIWVHKVE